MSLFFFGSGHCRIENLFVTVETGEITQVLASRTGYVTGISPLVFKAILLLFLPPKVFLRGLVSRILGRRLELGHGVKRMINLQTALFYVSDEGSMEDINITFMLCL